MHLISFLLTSFNNETNNAILQIAFVRLLLWAEVQPTLNLSAETIQRSSVLDQERYWYCIGIVGFNVPLDTL